LAFLLRIRCLAGWLLLFARSRHIVYGGAVPDTLLRPALKWLFRLRAELRWFLVGDAADFNGMFPASFHTCLRCRLPRSLLSLYLLPAASSPLHDAVAACAGTLPLNRLARIALSNMGGLQT
jgi:hypothetical protein